MTDDRIEQAVRTLRGPHMPVRMAVDLALREAGTVSGAASLLEVAETTLRDWIRRSGLEVGTYRVAFLRDHEMGEATVQMQPTAGGE